MIGVKGTSIVRTLRGNFTFYQDGSSLPACPTVVWNDVYDVDRSTNTTVILKPSPYLYCKGVFWEPTSIESTASDAKSSKSITGIFSSSGDYILQ